MTLSEIIANIDQQDEEATLFAKKVDGKFLPSSEAVSIALDDEELHLPVKEIADKYCPGFAYFLEVAIVKEQLEDLADTEGVTTAAQQVDRIIYYAEFDA